MLAVFRHADIVTFAATSFSFAFAFAFALAFAFAFAFALVFALALPLASTTLILLLPWLLGPRFLRLGAFSGEVTFVAAVVALLVTLFALVALAALLDLRRVHADGACVVGLWYLGSCTFKILTYLVHNGAETAHHHRDIVQVFDILGLESAQRTTKIFRSPDQALSHWRYRPASGNLDA